MKYRQLAYRVTLVLFSAVWAKLAVGLVFFFGPESAREWFGTRAIVAMVSFSIAVIFLNFYFLVKSPQRPTLKISRSSRAVIVVAFLGGIFACWDAGTTIKFFQIYIVVPAIIVLLASSPDLAMGRWYTTTIVTLSLILLWPGDTCENPANWWWLNKFGASPLTYLFPINVLGVLAYNNLGVVARFVVPLVVAVYFVGSVYHRFVQGY